jgi:hypothetical protein
VIVELRYLITNNVLEFRLNTAEALQAWGLPVLCCHNHADVFCPIGQRSKDRYGPRDLSTSQMRDDYRRIKFRIESVSNAQLDLLGSTRQDTDVHRSKK